MPSDRPGGVAVVAVVSVDTVYEIASARAGGGGPWPALLAEARVAGPHNSSFDPVDSWFAWDAMGIRSLKQTVDDLEQGGHLLRIEQPVDPHLEAAEIHRRVFERGGPALLFTNVRGTPFPMVSNLFGTLDRSRYMFRHTLENVQRLIELKLDPAQLARRPARYWKAPWSALRMLPKHKRHGAVLKSQTRISQLPHVQCWPEDGGAFVLLPQVYTEDVERSGWKHSNLGMYRIQLTGGQYKPDDEIGLHYQLHRGIGVHHRRALESGKPFRVNIFLGGHPAMTVAAVMPLPEGMSELTFAGALAGHRIPLVRRSNLLPIYADADFCICGTVDLGRNLPEGPFGDHLGYYSLEHPFPVLRVDRVYCRRDAIWPFTVVGRPPQEDTSFGALIHEITGPVIPSVLPGVHAVHAVDAAGVHPLLLAIGSERYVPFEEAPGPRELLTQAHAILGQGQLSLAKYLWIAARQDASDLDIHDVPGFFRHMLSRVDWSRDLHFQTRTTIDTLDYSGHGLNEGSKVIIAATGPVRRGLPGTLDELGPEASRLPDAFCNPRVLMPGVLAIQGPRYPVQPSFAPRGAGGTVQADLGEFDGTGDDPHMQRFCGFFQATDAINKFPLIVVVDDSDFVAESLNNFLWVVFTRSNPAADVYGIDSFHEAKHWGCRGALVVDARIKPHHAPQLVADPETVKKVDALASRGGDLARYL